MKTKTGRYSGYIRPFSYGLDLGIIVIINVYFSGIAFYADYYLLFIALAWFCIASQLGFYQVYRYTKPITIFNCTLKQAIAFATVSLALAYFYPRRNSLAVILKAVSLSVLLILVFKLFIYFFLRKYRILWGGNFRRVVLFGKEESIRALKSFFEESPDYGYHLIKVFDCAGPSQRRLKDCFEFVLEQQIDELYCSLSELSDKEVEELVFFADKNLKTLKFIPSEKQLLNLNTDFEYYGYIPVIAQRSISLDQLVHKVVKRVFDIVFSLGVIITLLSWLIPLLGLIIKWDSKGPVFFVQKRNGLNKREFICIKFRSMHINKYADQRQVTKNDHRVTRVGKFIRKSSIDELPQFFNVLRGDMSVVGPRPHMVSHTHMYAERIDKFMVRHFIKPGITGLAQTKGCRGEVQNDNDIINRLRYDIFYMEKWSLVLDLKIVLHTIYNTIRGDKKAY